MGVAAIAVDRHDRAVLGDEGCGGEALANKFSDGEFGNGAFAGRARGGDTPADFGESFRANLVDPPAGFKMRLVLCLGPASLEILHQRRRTGHLDTATSNQIDRPPVDQRNVRNHAVRRVLHGDARGLPEQVSQALVLLLPAGIDEPLARQRVQHPVLDAVDELDRLAFGGNPVVPAPRHMGRDVERKHAIGDRVAPMMIEQEPAVQALLP